MSVGKKISVCTSGSRGDTQPYIALALELQARGHQVKFCTEERMRPLVEEFGLTFHQIAGDPTGLLWERDAQVMLRDGNVMQLLKRVEAHNAPFFQQALADYESGCEGADIIVSAPLCMNQTYSLAERNGVPWIPLLLGPTKSEDYPFLFFSARSLGMKFLNKLTWSFVFLMMWRNEKNRINAWRTQHLKLGPITEWTGLAGKLEEAPFPLVMAVNRHMIPNATVPADWPSHWQVTGFLFVPDPPEDEVAPFVKEFVMESDLPVVYLGFGSMPAPDPLVLLKRAMTVCKHVQVRIVLCAGWSALEDHLNPSANNFVTPSDATVSEDKITLPERIVLVKAISHGWLFPHCAAVVHHCGVGTCAAALRGGAPSVCCPVMLDQPYNAGRLHDMSVAPAPIPFHKLNNTNLIDSIKEILATPAMKEKASQIAAEIATEDGVKTAVDIIENAPSLWGSVNKQ